VPESLPKVSIITVTFNAEKQLEKTILSVIQQTYSNTEYIIVDGLSKDNTAGIVKKYNSKISQWISEPDSGLYDAMNKGIRLSTGDYLWFINAGDEINDPGILETVMKNFPGMDFYYGETLLVDPDGNEIGIRSKMTSQRLPENLTWRKMNKGMIVNHQSIIVKKEIAPFYDLTYKYSADIDWTIRCLKNAKTIQNTGIILSRFMSNRVLGKFHAGGESKKHLWISLKERFRLSVHHFGLLPTLWHHTAILFKAFVFISRRSR
jgi:glycosyltransferase involved in cell wall biosynthesis